MQAQTRRQQDFRTRYGPWAVVTGASSGIGREIAQRLAEGGLHLVLVARNKVALDQLAAELAARFGIETRTIDLDLAREVSAEKLRAVTDDLDVGLLVAAAGFGTSGAFLDSPLEQELEMLSVNCRALMASSWHFGRRLAARGRGGMVLISSILGFQGAPYSAHYGATKAYVQALAEGLHVELSPLGVDVLASAPGPTNSGFASRAGLRMGMTLNAADVARSTLAALGRRSTVLPGFLSKLIMYSLAPLPRRARVRIMGRVMRGMTKHRVQADDATEVGGAKG
jgi:short-subunit dehydrogenase